MENDYILGGLSYLYYIKYLFAVQLLKTKSRQVVSDGLTYSGSLFKRN